MATKACRASLGCLSYLQQGRLRPSLLLTPVTDSVISPAKLFSEVYFLYLASSKIPPQLSENCNKPKMHPEALLGKYTKPLSDKSHRLYNSLSCLPQTQPQSFTMQYGQRGGMEGEHLMPNADSFFSELKI